jgi:hypothetical protein
LNKKKAASKQANHEVRIDSRLQNHPPLARTQKELNKRSKTLLFAAPYFDLAETKSHSPKRRAEPFTMSSFELVHWFFFFLFTL